jgi:hypothetical protein
VNPFADRLWNRRRTGRVTDAATSQTDAAGRVAGLTCATWACLLTAMFAAALAFDLLRMPVQVYDAVSEILDAQRVPSAWEAFRGSMTTSAYLRPLRIAQIKLLFDLSGGNYWLAYRGFHAFLLVAALFLFVRLLRVRTATDLCAAAFALVVFTGIHTFRGTVQEAFPINHFLEIVVCCLLALNLSYSRGGWLVDTAAVVTFAAAALTLESGILVWVVAVAAWLAGRPGISTRGVVAMTGALAGYVALRATLDTGVPTLIERSSGYGFQVLDPSELIARFGANPITFYAYNVVTSALTVLFSEPQNGVFLAVRTWLTGSMRLHTMVALASSLCTTALIATAAWIMVRDPGRRQHAPLLFVFAAVLAGNSVLSFAYTKTEIMSVAGAFYALAAYAAVQLIMSRRQGSRALAIVATIALLASSITWSVRSFGVHHLLRQQAFKHRNDWAHLPRLWHAEGRWPEDPQQRDLLRRLRSSALDTRPPTPASASRGADDWFGD